MKTLMVELGKKSYPIFIGEDFFARADFLKSKIRTPKVAVVSGKMVAELYLKKVKNALSGLQVLEIILPDGEQYKTLPSANQIFTELLEARYSRDTTIIALGGGVVGDIAGFVAATYQRGVDFVQIPTTLLGAVDSSVGGKTAVNHPLGKNMIGAFYQPSAVVIDLKTLDTLDARQFSAGIAEVIKYAILGDENFFVYLKKNIVALLRRDKKILTEVVYRCCRHKAKIVAEDERETGRRALLNLGHTFGHALENVAGYGVYLHGEAVAVGMMMAARMSERMGFINEKSVLEIRNLIEKSALPTTIEKTVSALDFRLAMAVDKKILGGRVRLVLLKSIGDAYLSDDYPPQYLNEIIEEFCLPKNP